jgi:WhiB family redox-sensing transcriptional regulator
MNNNLAWWERPLRKRDMEWMDEGLCRQIGDVFHEGDNYDQKQAKKVCKRCPVLEPCLEWALDQPGIGGILGGTSEPDRRKIHRSRRQEEAS